MTDEFMLYDEENNEIMSRKLLSHLRLAIDEQGLLEGANRDKVYTIVSEVSGYELRVDKGTTSEEWHIYEDKCLMALD